jgi:hypothetical protein
MKKYVGATVSLVLTLSVAACNKTEPPPTPTRHLEGQVFVVLRQGDSLKLGLVNIGLHRKADLSLWRDKALLDHQAKVDALKGEIEADQLELDRLRKAVKAAERERTTHNEIRPRVSREFGEDFWKTKDQQLFNSASRLSGQASQLEKTITRKLEEAVIFSDPATICDALPAPLVATQSNADGEFKLTLINTDTFSLTAMTSRKVGDTTEKLCWIVDVAEEDISKQILLTNTNLFTNS